MGETNKESGKANSGAAWLVADRTNSWALNDTDKEDNQANSRVARLAAIGINDWALGDTDDRANKANIRAETIRGQIDEIIILNNLSVYIPKLKK